MSTINHHAREVRLKIVYYGPGLGGTTTSLQALHRKLNPKTRGQLVSLATGTDRTLYFDFLPLRARVQQFSVRLQLYTVPGQVHYNSTRKLVLTGADAAVFVADSQPGRTGANEESLANLVDNLAEQGRSLSDLPLIFQYNKRDAPDAVPVAKLEALLNRRGVPAFETVATTGKGVFEALKSIASLALQHLTRDGKLAARPPRQTPPLGTPIPSSAGSAPAADVSPLLGSLQHLVDEVDHLAPEPPTTGSGEHAIPPPSGRSLGDLVRGRVRTSIAAVEHDIDRSDWAAAVRHAGHGFSKLAAELGEGSSSPAEAAAIAALRLGLPASWLQRFRESEQRVLGGGGVSSDDAQFALLYLAAAGLRADELSAI